MNEETLNKGYSYSRNIREINRCIEEIQEHENVAQIATTLLWAGNIGMLGDFEEVRQSILGKLRLELEKNEKEFEAL